jgi:hypothetical protein
LPSLLSKRLKKKGKFKKGMSISAMVKIQHGKYRKQTASFP